MLLPFRESVIVQCYVLEAIDIGFEVLLYVTLSLCLFQFCNHLDGEERAGCFAWFIFLVSLDDCVALPSGAMGLSAVCNCGIS